jgi:hypothetical protein
MPRREHFVGAQRQRIAVRPEVVVHDIEHHHEPERVRRVDERFQIFGPAIATVGREQQHAVVAPVAAPREVRDRHQLDHRDAEPHEVLEPLCCRPERALGGERADVQLVDDGAGPRPPAPLFVAPRMSTRIDDFARTVDVVRLETRRGVRDPRAVGEHEAIPRSCARAIRDRHVEARGVAHERQQVGLSFER